MSDAAFDRRSLLSGIGAAGAVVALGWPSTADAVSLEGLEGTWLVDVRPTQVNGTPEFRAVWSFVAGGVVISSDQRQTGQGGELPGHQTSGQGIWSSDADHAFKAKYVKWGSNGPFFAMLVRQFSGRLDASMDSFAVTGTLTAIGVKTGQVLFTEGFAADGTRMVLE